MNCSRCGHPVTEDLAGAYRDADVDESGLCHQCIRELAEHGAIADLFTEIRNALDQNQEEWDRLPIPEKAAFARKLAIEGSVQGGTIGHLETLRVMVASGLAETDHRRDTEKHGVEA